MATMTHEKTNIRPKIALYEPDIPQNTASIIRTCSCLGANLEIIEPCGFLFSDKRFKRIVKESGILQDYKDKQYFQKPSEKKRLRKQEGIQRGKRERQKLFTERGY